MALSVYILGLQQIITALDGIPTFVKRNNSLSVISSLHQLRSCSLSNCRLYSTNRFSCRPAGRSRRY